MKPGYRTTEFWILIATALAAALTAVEDQIDPKWSLAITAGMGALYGVSRGLAKRGQSPVAQRDDEDDDDDGGADCPSGIVPKMALIALLGLPLLLLSGGCASPKDVTTAEIRMMAGTNEMFRISQPKDTSFKRAEYRKPDGSVIVIEDYQSTANAAAVEAVKAQAQAQRDVAIRGMELVKEAGAKAAAANGVPAGMKMVPVDDPSRPQPEIEPAD